MRHGSILGHDLGHAYGDRARASRSALRPESDPLDYVARNFAVRFVRESSRGSMTSPTAAPEQTAQTETTEPEPEENEEPEAAPADGDRTEDLRSAANGEPWAENVAIATETEPGRLEVETDLIDPRGDSGSPEAQTAMQICEAAVSLLKEDGAQEPYVAVLEEDGTHWILHGHPAYPDGCTEV